jgi:hypothetical protein
LWSFWRASVTVMRWRAPPPVFPVARRSWDAFDVVASLFVLAVALHAGALVARGVTADYERLAIVWLCLQAGAVGLALYFWAERSAASRQVLRGAAIVDLLLLALGLVYPGLVAWSARALMTHPATYF